MIMTGSGAEEVESSISLVSSCTTAPLRRCRCLLVQCPLLKPPLPPLWSEKVREEVSQEQAVRSKLWG